MKAVFTGKITYTDGHSTYWPDGIDVTKEFMIADAYNYETVDRLCKFVNRELKAENRRYTEVQITCYDAVYSRNECGFLSLTKHSQNVTKQIKDFLSRMKIEYIDNPAYNQRKIDQTA